MKVIKPFESYTTFSQLKSGKDTLSLDKLSIIESNWVTVRTSNQFKFIPMSGKYSTRQYIYWARNGMEIKISKKPNGKHKFYTPYSHKDYCKFKLFCLDLI